MTGVWGVSEVDSESSAGPRVAFSGVLISKSCETLLLGLLISCGKLRGNIVKSLGFGHGRKSSN